MSKAIWKTQDGREIAVKDMDDRHLVNTIRMLERNAPNYKNKLLADGYSTLGFIQGEQAEYDIERDIAMLEETDPLDLLPDILPVYTALKWHASRRGLKLTTSHPKDE